MALLIFDHRIQNIPGQIEITYFHRQPPWPGSPHTCCGDMDYCGYVEVEYRVLDRKGYEANWLGNKLDYSDDAEIIQKATELLS